MLGDPPRFQHFMLQEIYQQPEVVQACLERYFPAALDLAETSESPIALNLPQSFYADLDQVHLVACGTSFHASLIGQYLLEQWAGVPTRVRCASEFRDAPLPLTPNTLTIALTQSGETADTLSA